MFVVRLALRNPYVVIVVVLGILVLSVPVLSRIPTDILPLFKTPAVQIVTLYPGMPAVTVEKDMSSRLQRWTGQSVGIEHQEARSMLGVSIVKDFFQEGVSLDSAMSQVTSYAMSDLYYLPPGTVPPMVMPFDPTATLPLCLLSVKSHVFNETQLYDIAYFQLRNRLQAIPGVIAPAVYGGKLRRILTYVDRAQLQARNLSPMDVVHTLDQYNVLIPTGSARLGSLEYQLVSNAMVPEVKELNDFPVKSKGSATVFLKDVGQAKDAAELQSNIVRVDGQRQLYVPIYRQPGANTIRVVDEIRQAIPELNKRLPSGINLNVVFDQSVFVRQAIWNLIQEGVLGSLLAALSVLLFLQSFRSTFFILLSLPLSILAAIIGLYYTHHSLNTMTLGGFAIAVGLLIDQSIVVLENTERHLRMGKEPGRAALEAALEVAHPVLVIVLCVCLVFFPVIFFTGMGKFLFTPLAVSVTLAMLASYIMALTLIPVCSAKFFHGRTLPSHGRETPVEPGGAWGFLNRAVLALQRGYGATLKGVLRFRWTVLFLVAGIFLFSLVYLYPRLGTEFFPSVDSGQFTIRVRANSGTRVEATEKILARVEQAIQREVGTSHLKQIITNIGVLNDWPAAYTPNAGPQDAFVLVQLLDENRSGRLSDQAYIQALRRALPREFPGIEFAFEPNSMLKAALNFGLSAPINVRVQGNNLETSYAIAQEVERHIREIPGTRDVRIQQRLDYPQLEVTIDRTKSAEVGLTQQEVVQNVVTAFNSSVSFSKTFWVDQHNGNHYWIGAQYPESAFKNVNTLLNVPITGIGQHHPVMLRNLVTIKPAVTPTEFTDYNINAVIDIFADVEGRDLGGVSRAVETSLAAMERKGQVPPGYTLLRRGEMETMKESFQGFKFGIALAIVLVYLLMVIQFRSFVDPLIVLFTIPLGLIGVFLMLYLTHTYLSIQSLMGIMVMVGIVVSFAVLMLDVANQRQKEGMSASQAIVEAAQVRLRPILMTKLAVVFGLIPMAVEGGVNTPLARAVIGGVVASTIFSLYVVPILYTLLKQGGKPHAA